MRAARSNPANERIRSEGRPEADEDFTYDAQRLAQIKTTRARRLNVIQIPLLRLAGMGFLSLVALFYDLAIHEVMPWHGWLVLAGLNMGYGLCAWLVTYRLYGRTGRLDLTLLFMHLDVLVWLVSLHHMEGSQLVLAFFLVARVADTIGFGFRRAFYFNHVVILAYLAYVAVLHLTGADKADLFQRLVVAAALYALGAYVALAGRTVTKLRLRNTSAVRQARGLLQQREGKARELQAQAVILQSAREEAEAANLSKSAFLANMSHEIRTPLNGVLGFAQLLRDPGVSEEERIDYAQTILDSGQALLTVLNDVLDLSKMQLGALQLVELPLEPGQLVDEAGRLFAANAAAKGLLLEASSHLLPGQRYRGDPTRLRQMLFKLVDNAVKFTAQGRVQVEVRARPRDDRHDTLEFVVSDTGIGIAPAQQGQLFKPFSQADNSSTRPFGGAGLGLAIVHELAHLMGGEAGVESSPGHGARVWFRVPSRPVDESPAQEAAPVVQASRQEQAAPRGQVLMVEDHAVNRALVKAMIERLGIQVSLAENGQQAVDLITSGHVYDVVLMDIRMPVMDGLEATRRIRRWEAAHQRQPLTIIALTASAGEEDRRQCMTSGMNDYLAKPVDIDDFEQVFAHLL